MVFYFVSDVHLGLDLPNCSAEKREKLFCEWLDMVAASLKREGGALYMLGDIFDFWFEYKRVAPMGFTRVLGRLADMRDAGIEVHFFVGNHDTWTFGYLERETGVIVHRGTETVNIDGLTITLGHGHRLPLPGKPLGAKIMNRVFNSKTAYNIFSRLLHPDCAMKFGLSWSSSNRKSRAIAHSFRGEKEPLVVYAREQLNCTIASDLFIFGHLHTPISYPLTTQSTLIILGEWITKPMYAKLENGKVELLEYK